MQELRLAGIHDDGENLVLETADGTSYLLRINQDLRTSIAKARRIQPARGYGFAGSFGPRDIQARFRQGATIDEIVAESGWDAERVRKYEWPIIAERQHILSAARNARISDLNSRSGAASYQDLTLDERLNRVLMAWRLDEAPQDWNTYQQESGQWTVTLDVEISQDLRSSLPLELHQPARWIYNPANQSIYASNDAAYFFMGRTQEALAEKEQSLSTPASSSESEASEAKEEPAESAPAPAEKPQVDFARHAQAPSSHGEKQGVRAVQVPRNHAQEEMLEELEARRGTRDFDSAAERKLQDLLERARRSGTQAGNAVEKAGGEQPQAEVPTEPQPEASQQETVTVEAQPSPAEEKAPLSSVPAEDSGEEPDAAAPVADAVEESGFTSRAERRNHMMRKYLASVEEEEEGGLLSDLNDGTSDDQSVQDEISAKLQEVRSERDAAGSSWRAQHQEVAPQEAETVQEAENEPASEQEAEESDSSVAEVSEAKTTEPVEATTATDEAAEEEATESAPVPSPEVAETATEETHTEPEIAQEQKAEEAESVEALAEAVDVIEQNNEAKAEEAKTAEEPAKATPAPEKTNRPARSSKAKRASVPSWDDIIFGSQRK